MGKIQLISKSRTYDVFDRVWVCGRFCPKYFQSTLYSDQHSFFDATDINKSKHNYFYKSSVRFTTMSAFLLVVHFTPVGWSILP